MMGGGGGAGAEFADECGGCAVGRGSGGFEGEAEDGGGAAEAFGGSGGGGWRGGGGGVHRRAPTEVEGEAVAARRSRRAASARARMAACF